MKSHLCGVLSLYKHVEPRESLICSISLLHVTFTFEGRLVPHHDIIFLLCVVCDQDISIIDTLPSCVHLSS